MAAFIPTGGLRWLDRSVTAAGTGYVTNIGRVLQMHYRNADNGKDVWIDVPTVREDEHD